MMGTFLQRYLLLRSILLVTLLLFSSFFLFSLLEEAPSTGYFTLGKINIPFFSPSVAERPSQLLYPVTEQHLSYKGFSSSLYDIEGELHLIELENAHGKIKFSRPVPLNTIYVQDFGKYITLGWNKAFISTAQERFSFFEDLPAIVTLYGVEYIPGKTPLLHLSDRGDVTPCADCEVLSYNGESVVFSVQGFSGFSLQLPSPPSLLSIDLPLTPLIDRPGDPGDPYKASALLALSENLSEGIFFDVPSLPVFELPAIGNNGTGDTLYYVDVFAEQKTNIAIKGSGDLIAQLGFTIPLDQEAYSHSLFDPIVTGVLKKPLTTKYKDNPLLENFQGNVTIFLKFFLNVTSGQEPGQYTNDIMIVSR